MEKPNFHDGMQLMEQLPQLRFEIQKLLEKRLEGKLVDKYTIPSAQRLIAKFLEDWASKNNYSIGVPLRVEVEIGPHPDSATISMWPDGFYLTRIIVSDSEAVPSLEAYLNDKYIPQSVKSRLTELMESEDFSDNARIARISDAQQVISYGVKSKRGCCGSHDEAFVAPENGETYLIGFNYSH